MKKIRVLVADDHAVVRIGIATLVNAQKDISVVGQAKNGIETVRLASDLHPDVIVMDLAMPRKDGVTATREILAQFPAVSILAITSFATPDVIAQALDAGASGALLKTAESSELLKAIRAVAKGERVISSEVQRLLKSNPPLPKLSSRQTEILSFVADGLTSKQIAERLGIQRDSVDKYVNALLEKIGASSRSEAVGIAIRRQLIKF